MKPMLTQTQPLGPRLCQYPFGLLIKSRTGVLKFVAESFKARDLACQELMAKPIDPRKSRNVDPWGFIEAELVGPPGLEDEIAFLERTLADDCAGIPTSCPAEHTLEFALEGRGHRSWVNVLSILSEPCITITYATFDHKGAWLERGMDAKPWRAQLGVGFSDPNRARAAWFGLLEKRNRLNGLIVTPWPDRDGAPTLHAVRSKEKITLGWDRREIFPIKLTPEEKRDLEAKQMAADSGLGSWC
jgi:hypothetical protein